MTHRQWVDIVVSFGAQKFIAEDIVSDVMIRVGEKGQSLNNNYIFISLKNEFLQEKEKINKTINEEFDLPIEEDNWYKDLKRNLKLLHQLLIQILIIDEVSISTLSKETGIPQYTLRKDLGDALRTVKMLIK